MGQGVQVKNGPSKICERQPIKIFTLSILEYLDPYDLLYLISRKFSVFTHADRIIVHLIRVSHLNLFSSEFTQIIEDTGSTCTFYGT